MAAVGAAAGDGLWIKSSDPHLAGGEKSFLKKIALISSINFLDQLD